MDMFPQWFIDWASGVSVWDVIAWAAIAWFTFRFIARKGWRSVKALAKGVMMADKILDAVKDLPDDMGALKGSMGSIQVKLDDVHHEMYPNSGNSLRDQVNAMRGELSEHLEWSKETVTEITARLEVLEPPLDRSKD